MWDGSLRSALTASATPRQLVLLAAYVAAGGSVPRAAVLVGIRPSTAKRHLADLRAPSGLTTEQLIYSGRAEGWSVVPSLEPGRVRAACGPLGPPGESGRGHRYVRRAIAATRRSIALLATPVDLLLALALSDTLGHTHCGAVTE